MSCNAMNHRQFMDLQKTFLIRKVELKFKYRFIESVDFG